MKNYGNLEEALDDARGFEKALANLNIDEDIAIADVSEDLILNVDDNKILFSPQIEMFEPFAAHVDASRTNMSAKQLLQTVTSDNCQSPFIINKNYRAMTDINSPFVSYAEEDGIILYSNYNFLIIYYLKSSVIKSLYCPDIKKMTNNTITLKYKMDAKQLKFKKGDMLFDYTGQSDQHVPRIGYRTKILYGSFYGYTADDAFVMSESYAERTRIDYSKKVFIPITKELKYLKNDLDKYFFTIGETSSEDYSQYFKIDSSDSMLSEFSNISQKHSKIFGSSVDSINGGTIKSFKVHIITKKTFDEKEEEYIYTPGMIDEIKTEYERQLLIKKDLYLKLSTAFNDEETPIKLTNELFGEWESSDIFSKVTLDNIATDYNIELDLIDYVLEVEVYKSEPTCVGDKFANVYAGKGVVSLILPDHLMTEQSDIIFNPLGLFGRNNWGTIFEIGLAKVIQDVENNIENKFDTMARISFINEKFIKEFDQEYYTKIKALLDYFDSGKQYDEFKESVKKNGFYLFVDNFPGITFKDFMDKFINEYETEFNINITLKDDIVYSKELMQYMRDRGFVSSVFGNDVVQEVHQEVFIGYNYWIKLFHTSYSKYNAISFANRYSKSTGEPPRGRTKGGGCHISWQSTAALIGHMENNPCSVELRTIKSDAIQDKNNFSRKMIKDGKYTMKNKYKSKTVNTLNNGLKMLGLKFSSIVDNNDAESFEDLQVDQEFEDVETSSSMKIEDLFSDDISEEVEQTDVSRAVEDEEEVVPHDPITGEVYES